MTCGYFFRYCARLIFNMGGVMGKLAGTQLGQSLLDEMQGHSIHDVRHLIDKLMDKEYDLHEPIQMTDYDVLKHREICTDLVFCIHGTHEKVQSTLSAINEKISVVLEAITFMQSSFLPCLSLVPFKGNKSGSDLINDFESLFLILKDTRSELDESHIRGLDEMEGHTVAIDSDEEDRLFEELDQLMEAQERMEAFTGNAHKFMANSVQRAFRLLEDLETSFRLVSFFVFANLFQLESNLFRQVCKAFNQNSDAFPNDEEPVIDGVDSLRNAIKLLRIPDVSKFELENMMDEGTNCMKKFSRTSRPESSNTENLQDETVLDLKVSYLIAGSELFRKLILNSQTSPVYCALVETHLSDLVSSKQLKLLSRGVVEINAADVGSIIYSTKSCCQEWFVLISGKLRIKPESISDENSSTKALKEDFEIWKGEIFGGFDFFEHDSDSVHFDIEVIEPCQYIEMKGKVLEELFEADEDVATDVYDMLGTFKMRCRRLFGVTDFFFLAQNRFVNLYLKIWIQQRYRKIDRLFLETEKKKDFLRGDLVQKCNGDPVRSIVEDLNGE